MLLENCNRKRKKAAHIGCSQASECGLLLCICHTASPYAASQAVDMVVRQASTESRNTPIDSSSGPQQVGSIICVSTDATVSKALSEAEGELSQMNLTRQRQIEDAQGLWARQLAEVEAVWEKRVAGGAVACDVCGMFDNNICHLTRTALIGCVQCRKVAVHTACYRIEALGDRT